MASQNNISDIDLFNKIIDKNIIFIYLGYFYKVFLRNISKKVIKIMQLNFPGQPKIH